MIITLGRHLIGVIALTIASLLIVPALDARAGLLPARSATTTTCPVVFWGSLPKTGSADHPVTLTGVRSGRHACFDRLVLDLSGAAAGYDVRYVAGVHREGVGSALPVRGGAVIRIVVAAAADDGHGQTTYTPPRPGELTATGGYRTFRQVAWGGSFEGQSTIALGVRARLPLRVFALDGPGDNGRLVIDVAHHW